jgi:Zn finger protein HypA/HybF involved in hydrogenase expression
MEDKHAYWIPVDCNVAGDSGIRCSNCDFFVSDHVDNIEEYYYCPKCGFIMGETIRAEIRRQGNSPIWKFKCPLCGEEWSEVYCDGSDMQIREVDVLRPKNSDKKTFKAYKQCRCCGLVVWSEPIVGNKDHE